MKRTYFSPETDGFYGAYYPHPQGSDCALILMLGDSADDYLARSGARWFQGLGCNVLAMSPAKHDYSHHNYPLERFGAAIRFLKSQGNTRLGVGGASTTGMLALLAAAYYPELTLTFAISPSDFVMEGFYQDKLDGTSERPGDHESTVSWEGKPLPYLPFAYRHPEYDRKLKEEAKAGGNFVASREMFDRSEELHPLRPEEMIPVERIHGLMLLIGAEDDCLWDTCRYIRRMKERLKAAPRNAICTPLIYEHGTHFLFPESMMKAMLPVGSSLMVRFAFKAGRDFPQECRKSREDVDRRIRAAVRLWRSAAL